MKKRNAILLLSLLLLPIISGVTIANPCLINNNYEKPFDEVGTIIGIVEDVTYISDTGYLQVYLEYYGTHNMYEFYNVTYDDYKELNRYDEYDQDTMITYISICEDDCICYIVDVERPPASLQIQLSYYIIVFAIGIFAGLLFRF